MHRCKLVEFDDKVFVVGQEAHYSIKISTGSVHLKNNFMDVVVKLIIVNIMCSNTGVSEAPNSL